MGGNSVHIALDDDGQVLLSDGGPGQVYAIQGTTLIKDWGLWRVNVFGQGIIKHPGPEAGGMFPGIHYGEHQVIAKPVMGFARFSGEQVSGLSWQDLDKRFAVPARMPDSSGVLAFYEALKDKGWKDVDKAEAA